MDVGMLWFDNDKNADLNTKVKRAATYYQKKYGQTPNLCFVHPTMLSENGSGSENGKAHKAGEVEIRSSISLLPNHFWLGVNQG